MVGRIGAAVVIAVGLLGTRKADEIIRHRVAPDRMAELQGLALAERDVEAVRPSDGEAFTSQGEGPTASGEHATWWGESGRPW
jgi:hypothetical protein